MERRISHGDLSVVEAAVGRVPLRVARFACGPAGAIGRAVGLPSDCVLVDAVGLDGLAVGVADRDGLGALAEVLGPLFRAHAHVLSGAPILVDHAGISGLVVDTGADGLVVVIRVVEGAVVVERSLHADLALTAVLVSAGAVPGAVSLGALLNILTPVARAAHAVRRRGAGLTHRSRPVTGRNAPGLRHEAGGLDERIAEGPLRALGLAGAIGELFTGLRVDAHIEAVAAPGADLVGLLLGDEADAGAQLSGQTLRVGLTVARAVAGSAGLRIFAHAHQALAVLVARARVSGVSSVRIRDADSVDDLARDEHRGAAGHPRLDARAIRIFAADDGLVLDQTGHAVDEIRWTAPVVSKDRGIAHVLTGAWQLGSILAAALRAEAKEARVLGVRGAVIAALARGAQETVWRLAARVWCHIHAHVGRDIRDRIWSGRVIRRVTFAVRSGGDIRCDVRSDIRRLGGRPSIVITILSARREGQGHYASNRHPLHRCLRGRAGSRARASLG